MIVYFDTSALVKFFIIEDGSELVEDLRMQADALATSRIAYVEACAAFKRLRREERLTQRDYLEARRSLEERWPDLAVADINELKAGELAAKHNLRGFDAIHLQAALDVWASARHPLLTFCTFDERQAQAARAEQLTVVPESAHLRVARAVHSRIRVGRMPR